MGAAGGSGGYLLLQCLWVRFGLEKPHRIMRMQAYMGTCARTEAMHNTCMWVHTRHMHHTCPHTNAIHTHTCAHPKQCTPVHPCTHLHAHDTPMLTHVHALALTRSHMHAHTSVQRDTCSHVCTQEHIYSHVCAHLHAQGYTLTHLPTQEHAHAYMYAHTCTCVDTHTCSHVCIHLHVRGHTHMQACLSKPGVSRASCHRCAFSPAQVATDFQPEADLIKKSALVKPVR